MIKICLTLNILFCILAQSMVLFAGGCVVAPIYRLWLLKNVSAKTVTNNSTKIIRNTCRKIQGRFLLASFICGPLCTGLYVYFNSLDRKRAKELCYQIRCTEQMMVWKNPRSSSDNQPKDEASSHITAVFKFQDRAAFSLGFIGWYWKRFQGAVDGINLASLYAAYYFTVQKKLTNAPSTDKIKPSQRPGTLEEAEEAKKTLSFLTKRTPASITPGSSSPNLE
ncbi:unnamed protein product [Gongylonema pulchrum]|uniref:Uncharacterized protein n=1 Tax=Gongylonema pulchrum TaxID=637853 RepID=A0A183EP54_9BILA|nr:unnamed protein product [Gongylonema pulchrum]